LYFWVVLPLNNPYCNMKSGFLNYIIITLVIFFYGCSKNEHTYSYIPQELKDMSVFKNGSYWIYLNENTGLLDSCYTDGAPVIWYTDLSTKGVFHHEERIIGYLNSSFLRWYSLHTTFLSYVLPNSVVSFITDISEGDTILTSTYRSFTYIEKIPKYSLNNIEYSDVFHTKTAWKLENDSIIYTFHIADHVGLIRLNKRIGNADTTWSLLRFHVIQ
jgi:hypothetical protein